MMKVAVLGSTGSIGCQTLDVVRRHPEKLEVVAIAAGRRGEQAAAQAREFGVRRIALGDAEAAAAFEGIEGVEVGVGPQAVIAAAIESDADIVVNALVGAAGLEASYETLRAGKILALANKESLVVGGDLIMPLAAQIASERGRDALMPIDSEHGAIYQCLIGESKNEVARL